MKYFKKLFITIFLLFCINCLFFVVNANWEICDLWTINFLGNNFDEICNWWNKVSNFTSITNLFWSYININLWFFWTNNIKKIDYLDIQNNYPTWYFDNNTKTKISSVNPKHSTPVWFLWLNNSKNLLNLNINDNYPTWYFDNNTKTKISSVNPKYITPVWFFQTYSWQILDFRLNKILDENILDENILDNNILVDNNILDDNPILDNNIQVDDNILVDSNILVDNFIDKTSKSKVPNIVYNIEKQNYLTVIESLNYIYWQKFTTQQLFEKLYYLFPYIKLEETVNYYDLSLLLVNIYWNIIIEDKELSFKLLTDIGIYNSTIWKTQFVYLDELLILLSKKNFFTDFKKNIISNIDNNFYINNEKVFNDLLKTYYINKQLKNENISNKDKLISCFKYERCSEMDLYINFNEEITNLINIKESKELWINFNNNDVITWKNYINILFKVVSKEEFYKNKYSLDEYNKFINILSEAIIYSEWIENTKLTFVDYYSLQLELLTNEKLYYSIQYLTNNHLKIINNIYEKLNDKSKLLLIIRDYLNN